MEASADFEDMLAVLEAHQVRYLIIGGLAFIYHAKPRYTKDIDIWLDPERENVERANRALADFGSPYLLDPDALREILQLGVEPNRIDLLRDPGSAEPSFADAWERRVRGGYGRVTANWIDLDGLLAIKSRIDHPRHQEDARVLRLVKDSRREPES